jgi:hypothetical protein
VALLKDVFIVEIETAARRPVSIFFGTDRGMVFFLVFLVFTRLLVPMFPLSQMGRLGVAFSFVLTLTLGGAGDGPAQIAEVPGGRNRAVLSGCGVDG